MTKQLLYDYGMARLGEFVAANKLVLPKIKLVGHTNIGTCGYYQRNSITLSVNQCAHKAGPNRGRNWNWPGSTTDRTPYGVLAHELGHHADWHKGDKHAKYWSEYSTNVYKKAKEKAITSYCPDPSEWFAEMFRLFVTNPNLLRQLRPYTYDLLVRDFTPLGDTPWVQVLNSIFVCPDYLESNLHKKITQAKASKRK